jgi:hypothetical protein
MNDDQLLTAVRDAFAGVRLDVSAAETMRRGRTLRARRRLAFRAAGTAVLAGVTAAVAITSGVGHAPIPSMTEQKIVPAPAVTGTRDSGGTLDAWTVTARPDGVVDVTVRQLTNAAGLQHSLRAAGVPARVAFRAGLPSSSPALPAGCTSVNMSDQANANLQAKILSMSAAGLEEGIALTIHTHAIPKGVGVYLAVGYGSGHQSWGWGLDLVQTAPSCTG